MIALMGIDPITGSTRFIFDNYELSEGVALIPFLVGLFAVPEVISIIIATRKKRSNREPEPPAIEVQGDRLKLREVMPYWKTIVQSALVGCGLGALPGLGSTAAAFTCYGLAKKTSKNPEKYGNGSIEGLLACETGNNGTCGPALIPLLTLGIPGSSTTAVLFGALLIYGIVPGPKIFIENGPIVYAIFMGLVLGGFLLYPVATSIVKYAAKGIYKLNQGILFAGILLLCFTGSFAINNSMMDVYCMCLAGVFGFGMKYFGFPLGPTLIAFILEPIMERSFRQALMISGNDVTILFSSPIAIGLYVMFIAVLTYGPVKSYFMKRREKSATANAM